MEKLSIKLKVALATTMLSLTLIAVATALVFHSLRTSLSQVLIEQQTSLVNGTAKELDNKLALDLEILTGEAALIPADILISPKALREYLSGQPTLLVVFDDLLVIDRSGQVIADLPELPGRTNVNASDRAFFKQVMTDGRPVISEPLLSRQRREPVVNMGAPIRDQHGKTVAVLTGVLRLQKSNVLGDLATARNGATGYFVIIAKSPVPTYVMHPDKARILEARVGGTASVGRALAGVEGTIEDTNSQGLRALFSFKSLHATDWLLVAVLPAAEAFAPIREAELQVVIVAGALALMAAPSVWLLVYGLLAPLSRFRARIQAMRLAPGGLSRLQADGADEIGELARAINLLLDERAEAEQRQHQSESRFEAAADSSIDAFFLFDAERDSLGHIVGFRLRFANAQAHTLLGLASADLRGRSLSEILPLGDSPDLFASYVRTVDGGEPLDVEFKVCTPRLDAQWLHQKVVRVGDGLAVTASDVTRRRRDEEQIERQKTFLQTLVENLPVGLTVRSMRGADAGKIILCNLADEVIYGVSAQAAIGHTVRETLPIDAAKRVEERDRDLLATRMVQEITETFELPGQDPRTLRMVRAPVFGLDDEVDHVISITTDITSEQRKTDELRLASKVFESTADAIVVSDADDRVIMVNRAFTQLTGYAPNEMLGQLLAESPFRPLDMVASAERMARQLRDGVLTTEVLRKRKDGTFLHLWVTATFVHADDGRIVNNVRVFTDISELKATQKRLEDLAGADPLTGLPNRRLFQDRLDHAIARLERTEHRIALLFVDLDGFKSVNDTVGHDVGDHLLKVMATRLTNSVRPGDSVCRLGGDEFVLILEVGDPASDGSEVAQRVLAACALPVIDGAHTLRISASIGIAVFPDEARDATTLLARADAAMYSAKRAGGNRYARLSEHGILSGDRVYPKTRTKAAA